MNAASRHADSTSGRRPDHHTVVPVVVGGLLVAGSLAQAAWVARDLGVGTLALRVGLLLAAAVGGGLLALALRGPLVRPPASSPTEEPPQPAPGPPLGTARQGDDPLLGRVLEVRDLLDSPALRARLDDGISSAGFEVLAPRPGERFDPAVHTAVDSEAAPEGATPGTIASVEQVGLRQGTTLLRRASVVVWRDRP